MRQNLRALPLLLLAACSGRGAVEYVDGQCLIGGVAASLAEVESHQAALTQHILARQPWLTGIAVAAVVIAGASYVQRLLTVLAARRASATSFGDRVRARMERYRAHPVRYFAILGTTLAILAMAGATYVKLDADKRTSERALATLQFCHLALRTADEQHVLTEQRDNLEAIQATAGDIRALVDKLPPAEQQKAHDIVDQLTTTLGTQRTLVTRYAAQADESARAVAAKQADVARGLTKLDGEVGSLAAVPTAIDKLGGTLGGALHELGARHDALDGELLAYRTRLDSIDKTLADLASRPPPTPVCTCVAPTPVASAPPSPSSSPSPQAKLDPPPKPNPKPELKAKADPKPSPSPAPASTPATAPTLTPTGAPASTPGAGSA